MSAAGNRYVRYQAGFSGNGSVTPTLSRVDIDYTGNQPSALTSYGIDTPMSLYGQAHYDSFSLGSAKL